MIYNNRLARSPNRKSRPAEKNLVVKVTWCLIEHLETRPKSLVDPKMVLKWPVFSDYSIVVKWMLLFQIIVVWQLFAVISDCNFVAKWLQLFQMRIICKIAALTSDYIYLKMAAITFKLCWFENGCYYFRLYSFENGCYYFRIY